MTDPLGQSQVIPYLIGLSEKGYEFTILSAEKKENFSQHHTEIKKILDKSNILWKPVFYTKNPPVLSTVSDIAKLKREAEKLHKINHYSIVHCRSYIASFAGLYLKKKYKIRFIFDMRGFYADERVEGNLWNLKNPLYYLVFRYFKNKETGFLKNADYIITLTHAAKNIIRSWKVFNGYEPKIEVIPCCADLDHFSPGKIEKEAQQKLRVEFNIPETGFVLSYLGSLGTWYMADEMMLFFKCLLKEKPEARFFLITPDPPENIFRLAEKFEISASSIIIRKARREQVPLYLSISTFSLFFIKPVFSKKASSPTKMGEIMGMGIPVICNAGVGDVDKIMNNSGAGFILENFSTTSMLKCAGLLMESRFNSAEIRLQAKKYFGLTKGADLYNSVYEKLII